ncbi:MAG: methylated-DNA--[protein]-cysteine S-methyltransferase, partial [Pseudomonadota bacterium]|nr:methylated-DNA--[protein]-cysteine S-methyltransferase [Pseudomonadota bacterium]
AIGPVSLGQVLVGITDKGICAILLGDDPAVLEADLRARFSRATVAPAPEAAADLLARVVALVDDPRPGHDLPLDVRGTAFQRRVWEALQAIPPGETVSYGALAARLGAPRAVRAIASACAANAVAVAIPCHRVVGATGALSGYRWGIARKQALLTRERAEKG